MAIKRQIERIETIVAQVESNALWLHNAAVAADKFDQKRIDSPVEDFEV